MIALISVNRKRRANCFRVVISETVVFFEKIKLLFVKDCLMLGLKVLFSTENYEYNRKSYIKFIKIIGLL